MRIRRRQQAHPSRHSSIRGAGLQRALYVRVGFVIKYVKACERTEESFTQDRAHSASPHKQGHHQGPHIRRCLRERVLKPRDGPLRQLVWGQSNFVANRRKDLGERDQDVSIAYEIQ